MRAFINWLEETLLVILLAVMVGLSFTQVVARYVFNSGWNGALELTTLLFAWLVLIGMSYGIRVGGHLGVDTFIRLLPQRGYRMMVVMGIVLCFLWAMLLLDTQWLTWIFPIQDRGGAYTYVSKMYQFGIEMEDLPIPRWIGYIILPLGLSLFAYRCCETLVQVMRGTCAGIISAHETPHTPQATRSAEQTLIDTEIPTALSEHKPHIQKPTHRSLRQ